ncbi:MAG TPA: hypothetical protein VM487_10015 [Phycisphaerae bacterium]|nr:hypothetical protein [Phycisphaerae bacterium]
MGWFGKKRSPLEKRLLDEHSSILAQLFGSAREGRQVAEGYLGLARQKAEETGVLGVSSQGEDYLARAASDPEFGARLAVKRKDGVTDEDIRWWWNMDGLERCMMCVSDENSRMALFMSSKQEAGLTAQEAGAKVNRYLPLYGDMSRPTDPQGDDRPLPFELKDRINKWRMKKMGDPEGLSRQLDSVSSFNALVRKEIRAGNL